MIPPPEGHNDTPHFANFSGAQLEQLIFALIRKEYPGTNPFRPGPIKQHGFDIQVTLKDGTKIFYECKGRQYSLSGPELKTAVNRFLAGNMRCWANVFHVITSGVSGSTVKDEKLWAELECERHGIKFEYESREGLWQRLLNYPEIVQKYLGKFWADESRLWCEARLAENREQKRREQSELTDSGEDRYYYRDGYLTLTFLLPSASRFDICASMHIKTEGVEGVLITFGNDDTLNTFDEFVWRDEKPLLAATYDEKLYAQIGNVRVELSHALFSKLAQHLRSVRDRWLESISLRDREREAEGYRYVDQDHIKIGQIQAGMWRYMIRFAMEHDCDKGHSQWHIFDPSTAMLKVYTNVQTDEMDPDYHLLLTTNPYVSDSTGADECVDLIWHEPFSVKKGVSARGRRGPWGCDTAVEWLKEEFIPLLISLHWPAIKSLTWLQKIFGRSPEHHTVPKAEDFFYSKKATDWSTTPVSDGASLFAMLSTLQIHYSYRNEAIYPATYFELTDKALLFVLKLATNSYYGYIAEKAELIMNDCKEDLVRQLTERLNKSYKASSGFLLGRRLEAILDALGEIEFCNLNSAECRKMAETLRPLAQSAALFNRLLAHRSVASHIYPM